MGASAVTANAQPTDLFISEYVEGSSNNKAIEIYNGTASPINLVLGGYQLRIYANGSATSTGTIALTGTIAAGATHIVASNVADPALTNIAQQLSASLNFNGDDAVALVKSSGTITLDVIGQIGFDPGTQWGTGLVSTEDNTIRRKATVCQGDPNGADAFVPATEWDGFAIDIFNGLGSHTASCSSSAANCSIMTVGSTDCVGANRLVTVSVTDTPGPVTDGTAVQLTVTGANPGVLNSTTNAGVAVFGYIGTSAGVDSYASSGTVNSHAFSCSQPNAVTWTARPAAPTGTAAYTSGIGMPVTMTVSVGAGETADWSLASCGGAVMPGGTGTLSVTVVPSSASTTTFYVVARSTSGVCSGVSSATCLQVTLTGVAGITDGTATGPTIDGGAAPGANEYGPGNSYRWVGSKGSSSNFGGILGDGSIYLKSDTTGPNASSLTVGYQQGPGALGSDIVVVLLDTQAGSASATITGSGDQVAIGRVLTNTNASTLMGPDFAVVFSGGGQALYALNGGTATSIGSFGSTIRQPGTTNTAFRELSINYSLLGLSGGSVVKFIAGLSSGTGYLSSESIPASSMTDNPGFAPATGTYSNFGQFTTLPCPAVVIDTQPGPAIQSKCTGDMVVYSVAASGGSGGLTYQWRKGGSNILVGTNATATSSALVISSAATGDTGSYDCVVTAGCGSSATSSAVSLTVNTVPPNPTNGQASTTAICVTSAGSQIFLNADIAISPATVEWFSGSCGGTLVGSNSGGPFSISAPTVTTTYFARVKNAAGCPSAGCTSVTITVYPQIVINTPPTSTSACLGTPATFSVSASGLDLAYQWRRGTTNIFDATGPSYTIPSVAAGDAGSDYNVVVSQPRCSSVTSASATLTVASPPSSALSVTPLSAEVCFNNGTFVVVGASETGVSYQLRVGGTPVVVSAPVNGTGGSINLLTGALTSTTTFNVLATRSGCTSVQLAQTATVTVNPQPATPTGTTTHSAFTGSSLVISVSVNSGETVDWYGAACGSGSVLATGQTSLTIPSVASGTTPYFARARHIANGCISSSCLQVNVTGTGQVVISQVYGGGGNSGAQYQNDFVELFNRGTSAVDLTGWTVQYAGASSAFNAADATLTVTLSGSIAPSGYYLVKANSNAAVGALLPTAQATNTNIAMGASNGKVALANNGVTVTGPTATNVVDFIGYGTANQSEGTAVGALSNTTAAFRNNNGCVDTNSNSADFSIGTTPRPRNSAAPLCKCAGGLTDTFTDTVGADGSINGTLDAGEFGSGNSYMYGGDGASFQGKIGYFANSISDNTLVLKPRVFMGSSNSSLRIGVRLGADLVADDTVVVFLDTKAGGFSSVPGFTDTTDASRAAIARGIRSPKPANFTIDYAVAFNQFGIFLYSFDGSTLSFIGGTGTSGTGLSAAQFREIRIPYSLIGFVIGDTYKFIATLNNGSTSAMLMSDETVPVSPALSGAGNQGATTAGTFTNYNQFTTYCTPPVSIIGVNPTASSICSGDSTSIVLSSTEIGISYQLRIGTTPIGPPQSGAGGPLTFPTGVLTATGTPSSTTTFNIFATRTICGSTVQQDSTAAVTVSAQPTNDRAVAATDPTVCAGGSTTITVGLSQMGISYRLHIGGTPVGVAQIGNGGTLTFGSETINTNTTFSIVATNAPCSPPVTLTQTAAVAVTPLTTTSNPTASSQCFGSTTMFSVIPGGTSPFSYQWEQSTNAGVSWAPAAGTGTDAATMTTSAAAADGTLFHCIVTGACGSATSSPATLTVNNAPAISLFAVSPSGPVCAGNTITFSAGASGTAPLTYTFKKGGSTVQTGAGTTYTIASAAAGDADSYTVEVSNTCGTAPSLPIVLTVNATPVAPTGASVDTSAYCSSSAPATITLTAAGGSGDTLRWFDDSCGGNSIGTGNNLLIAAPTSAGVHTYFARWESTASCGNSSCASTTVTVTAAPTSIAGSPQTICSPSTVSLTGVATNFASTAWTTSGDGAFADAAAQSTVYTPGSTDVSTGSVTLTLRANGNGPCTFVDSSVLITINQPPTLSAGSNQTICAGSPATLTGSSTHTASVLWTTSGTGAFADVTSATTSYTPSPADIAAHSVTLTLSGVALTACTDPASSQIILTITQPTITLQPPSAASQCAGFSTSFAVTATGTNLTYAWQQSTDSGNSWPPAAGTNSNASYTTSPVATTGTLFRCIIGSDCGSITSNLVTLSVTPNVSLALSLQLQSVDAAPFTRCIQIDLYTAASCPSPAFSTQQTVTFTNGLGSASVSAGCDTYIGVAVRDPRHTLRRVATAMPAFNSADPSNLIATFTTASSKALIGGNANDDAYIDILDFGAYIGQSGSSPGASTTCPPTGLHTDFSGNGSVSVEDFTFIQSNFFVARDTDPCSNPLIDGEPVVDISVAELVARGQWDAARGDLNRDSRLNAADIAFIAANGLATCPANFNGLGPTDVQDIFAFLSAWFEGHPAADINRDGRLSVPDVFDFMNTWFSGC